MDSTRLQPLPLGNSDFEMIRSNGKIYVDKTVYLARMLATGDRFFLSRPRRFGKSLLISTFESLFTQGLKYFSGLEISKHWNDKTYPTVHLDFSELDDFSGVDGFRKAFSNLLSRQFAKVGFRYDPDSYDTAIGQISSWLQDQESSSLVLLIDEYDAPLTLCLNNPALFEQVRKVLSSFYKTVKRCDGKWRFVFITGIAKFSKMSIFSGMNNLEDISLNPLYSALLGYTEEEIEHYFAPYLDNAVGLVTEPAELTKEEIIFELKRHYDGFCFGMDAKTQVYAPWSTLSFLKNPQLNFANYWFDSAGQPSMMLNYFKAHSFKNPEGFFAQKDIPLETLSLSSGAEDIDDTALMTQAGYLTIKNRKGRTLEVGYPNDEVRESIARLYTEQILTKAGYNLINNDEYKKVLGNGKGENIFTMFNRLIDNLSYNVFEESVREAMIVSLYQLFMIGAGLDPHVEKVSAKGRSDLQVTIGNRHLVLEFKVQREGKTPEFKLDEAVKQIIENRYGEGSFARELFRLALVFSEKERRFVKWQEVPVQ